MSISLEAILSYIGDFLFMIPEYANDIPSFEIIAILLLLFFAYNSFYAIFYVPIFILFFAQYELGQNFWNIFFIISAVFCVPLIRRIILTSVIVRIIEKTGLMPKISQTEEIALTSGTVWVDGQLFSGKPDFKWIFSQKYPHLTEEEKSFLENEVDEVCKMCVDNDVQTQRDLPSIVWKYLKDKKFFGMIIPKEYGGLGFSAYAHSCVVETLASRSVPLSITVMVPNSLGPAELLLHYGTEEQKNYYLPRLAKGEEIPCFALTSPVAGSDAASLIDNGIVCEAEINGKKQKAIRLNWDKRYITLSPIATLIG
ncbi:MAG TPA: acyl-CoA dehydrogenase family protein, partial [Rickettsiales bacterium]|nr:acyl-CoA dehydrogenase family protein [Rickettsiales bacterium]